MAYLIDDIAAGIADVPADAINAATGTGEDLGWFGDIDRSLDPRGIADTREEAIDTDAEGFVAETSPGTTGLSGFLRGSTEAGSALGADLAELTTRPLTNYLFGGGTEPTDDTSQAGLNWQLLLVLGAAAGGLYLVVNR